MSVACKQSNSEPGDDAVSRVNGIIRAHDWDSGGAVSQVCIVTPRGQKLILTKNDCGTALLEHICQSVTLLGEYPTNEFGQQTFLTSSFEVREGHASYSSGEP